MHNSWNQTFFIYHLSYTGLVLPQTRHNHLYLSYMGCILLETRCFDHFCLIQDVPFLKLDFIFIRSILSILSIQSYQINQYTNHFNHLFSIIKLIHVTRLTILPSLIWHSSPFERSFMPSIYKNSLKGHYTLSITGAEIFSFSLKQRRFDIVSKSGKYRHLKMSHWSHTTYLSI